MSTADRLDETERTRALVGRVFARTQGLNVDDDCTRYRMVRARVGQRIVEVFSDAGVQLGTLTEHRVGGIPAWTAAVQGSEYTRTSFEVALDELEKHGAERTR